MKKSLLVALALIVVTLQSAYAGALYGTLRVNAAPAASYAVFLACPGQQPIAATTDVRGGFTLRSQSVGSCSMWVQRGNVAGNKFPVFVSDKPLRLDLSVDASLNKR
jgi:hypothetical protein